jgi:hypothetical protein
MYPEGVLTLNLFGLGRTAAMRAASFLVSWDGSLLKNIVAAE